MSNRGQSTVHKEIEIVAKGEVGDRRRKKKGRRGRGKGKGRCFHVFGVVVVEAFVTLWNPEMQREGGRVKGKGGEESKRKEGLLINK